MPRGSTFLLYSDGLVERRDRPLRSGLDALVVALERTPSERRGTLCEAVTAELIGRDGADDDVCVLAIRLT